MVVGPSPVEPEADVALARGLVEGAVGFEGLASVMSPPDCCDEQPARHARHIKEIDKKIRLTVAFPIISRPKYKVERAHLVCPRARRTDW